MGLLAVGIGERQMIFRICTSLVDAFGLRDRLFDRIQQNSTSEFELRKNNVYFFPSFRPQRNTGRFGCFSLYWTLPGDVQCLATLHSWLPGWRTISDWIKLLQRRVKASFMRRKKVQAVVMALHQRLGYYANISVLGSDVVENICWML